MIDLPNSLIAKLSPEDLASYMDLRGRMITAHAEEEKHCERIRAIHVLLEMPREEMKRVADEMAVLMTRYELPLKDLLMVFPEHELRRSLAEAALEKYSNVVVTRVMQFWPETLQYGITIRANPLADPKEMVAAITELAASVLPDKQGFARFHVEGRRDDIVVVTKRGKFGLITKSGFGLGLGVGQWIRGDGPLYWYESPKRLCTDLWSQHKLEESEEEIYPDLEDE